MKTIISKVLIILTMATFFLTYGCGESGSSTADTAAGTPEKTSKTNKLISPCSLVTKVEAEKILGEPLKDPEIQNTDNNPMGQKICFFSSASEGSFIYLQISVIQTAAMPARMKSSGMNAAKIYHGTKENMTDIKELKGIGDEAFWGTLGLHILTNDAYIVVSVGSSGKPANMKKAQKIAELILKRL
jgi:hypothetical protein